MKELVRIATEADLPWEPYEVDGEPAGEVQLLRRRDTENNPLIVGVYRIPFEMTGEYVYDHDDALLVLEGAVDLTMSDGTELRLVAGQMAAFRKGQTVKYRYGAGFKKFFVQSGY